MQKRFILVLLLLFILRTMYGLCNEFWFEDELQIYLIGLKYYTTGAWPYFGPDLVYTNTQIPGALQALLVAIPLFIVHEPESPIIFLNILSFSTLCFLAWYISKRIKIVPYWFIWIWVLTAPWVMCYSTRVVNPSYVLPFSILFFIGFFEMFPVYKSRLLHLNLCAFLMGLTTTCIMQLHLSWVLLLPLTAAAFYFRMKEDKFRILNRCGFYCLGFILGLLTLLPTLMNHTVAASGGTEKNIVFNLDNIKNIITIITRYLSFAAYEVPYMLGGNTPARLEVIKSEIWMSPFALFLLVIGWLQVIFFITCFFLKNKSEGWKAIKWINALTCLLLFLSFFFSIKGPSSHTFYLLLPLVMLYSFYCYEWLLERKPEMKKLLLTILIAGFLFHIGLALNNYTIRSLYINRKLVKEAFDKKDYKILGKRRADDWGYGY
ncbi:MAG: hypothetical protein HY841_15295 [Bacteroidetes bacterium]|nr:hypothetical protein [Bacteroidota bacterium]